MIALLTAAALAGDPKAPLDSAFGLGADVAALRGSSRHDVTTGVRAWGTVSPRPWSATAEIAIAPHTDRTAMYTYRNLSVQASALAEVALAPHRTTFRAGLGPAFVLRGSVFQADGLDALAYHPEAGLRARVALDGPLGAHLAWTWHMGAVAHPSGTDWDVGFGLGVAP